MNNNCSNREVEFRKIPSLKFLYEISEDGRIIRNVKSKHQMSMEKDRGGYYRTHVMLNGKQVHRFVHILVAECWLGDKPNGNEVDHIDRNRQNNHYKNLRYVTREQNHENRVFSEEGRKRNGEITRARYFNASEEGKKKIIRGMREAWENDDGTLLNKRINACRESWRNATQAEKRRRLSNSMMVNSTPVVIKGEEAVYSFPSKAACSRFLSIKTGVKRTTIIGRLNARRKNILGYDISYSR